LNKLPKKILGKITITIKNFIANHVNAKDINFSVDMEILKNEILFFPKISIYDGLLTGAIKINLNNTLSSYEINYTLKNLQLDKMAPNVKNHVLTGSLNSNGALSSVGNTIEAFLSNLNGLIDFSVTNGTMYGVDFTKPTLLTPTDKTLFDKISGKAVIQQKTASTNNFLLQSPTLNVMGIGSVNVITQDITMALHALSASTIQVTGTLTDPHYSRK
jgi:uncharacterized protein involved in outer membrane biogenesis